MTKEQIIAKAEEAYTDYIESVGDFYMQDPAERQAAEEVYQETFEEYYDGDTDWLAEEEADALERLEYRYGRLEDYE